jgi:membrane protein
MVRAGRVVRLTWERVRSDGVADLAAMLTYYAIFALFPFALFVVSVTLLVLPVQVLHDAIDMTARAAPAQVGGLFREHATRLVDATHGGFALMGALLALWGASRGALALGRALNRMHGVKESRGFLRVQLTAIAVTLAAVALALIALSLLVVGPIAGHWIADRFGLGATFDVAWNVGRWIGAALLVMLVWAILLYFLPDQKRPFRWVTPGAIAGTLIWVGVSRLFALYVNNFGRYEATYGALGAVIVFLIWLWLTNLALLLGGEIDDALDLLRRPGERLAPSSSMERKDLVVRDRPHGAMIKGDEPVGELARRIGDDLQALAKDHVELAKLEVSRSMKSAITDGVAALLGGIVSLIGFAMLCVTAVIGLEPLIPALWLRMLIMSIVYLFLGGAIAAGFARKLKQEVPPRLERAREEARETVTALKAEVQHG